MMHVLPSYVLGNGRVVGSKSTGRNTWCSIYVGIHMNLEFERFFIFYYSRPDIYLNLNHARAVYPFLPYLSPIPPYLLKINYCFINNFGYISSMYPTFQPYPLVVYIWSVSYNWYGSKVEVYMLPSCMLSRSKI